MTQDLLATPRRTTAPVTRSPGWTPNERSDRESRVESESYRGGESEAEADDRAYWSADEGRESSRLRSPWPVGRIPASGTFATTERRTVDRREASPYQLPRQPERRESRNKTRHPRPEQPHREGIRQARKRHRQSRDDPQLRPGTIDIMATSGGGERESETSDLVGNRETTTIHRFLDIRDATDNPNWEMETFALCDLNWCGRCEKFYAPMRTVQHRCRI